ncbi:MAG: gluconokinase [Litorilinea sp.]
MSDPYVLTLDLGTSSVRAMLFDAAARPVANSVAQRQVRPHTTTDGGATFDPHELLAAVEDVIDQVLHSAGPQAQHIGAVAMGTLVGNIMGVDAQDAPVSPVYIYADTRNTDDPQALRRELGAEGVEAAHDRTGCLIHTSYLPARLRWLQRVQTEEFRQAQRWVSVGEYIYHAFLGEWCASYSVAAWTGMLDRRALTWDSEWLAHLGLDAGLLSPLGDLSEPLQGLRAQYAERWPALANARWLPAIGDGAAANVGSGCVEPDRIALTVGTTGAMRVVVDPDLDRVPDGLWLYRVDARRGLLGGATTEGGNVFAWLQDALVLPDAGTLEAQLSELEPAAHGLAVLPFWGGERAPGWREDARGTIHGLRLSTRPVEIVQACLEAMSYRFAMIYDRIAPHLARGRPTDAAEREPAIVASGGAILSSPVWLQLTADVLGRPLHTLAESEATSRGLAVLALEQLGVVEHAVQLVAATGRVYVPRPAYYAVHREALARQRELYADLLT